MIKIPVLISFVQDKKGNFIKKLAGTCKEAGSELDLYIDSGAYTAFTSGVPIKIESYMKFLDMIKEYASWYANLDAIGDSEETWKNQRILEENGFSPVPVFHQGSRLDLFREIITTYTGKIALGGIAGRPKWMFPLFLKVCADILVGTNDRPENHIHIFGVSPTPELCGIHPWGSYDSSTGMGFRWNRIISPHGRILKISDLNGYKSKNIFLKSIQEQLHFDETTISILSEAKRPTRGYDSGLFWNTLGLLCQVKVLQDILDKAESDAIYYTVMGGLKSPFVDLFVNGVKNIYEHKANKCISN